MHTNFLKVTILIKIILISVLVANINSIKIYSNFKYDFKEIRKPLIVNKTENALNESDKITEADKHYEEEHDSDYPSVQIKFLSTIGHKNGDENNEDGNSRFRKLGKINQRTSDYDAKMARFVVANSLWTSVATISSREPTKTFPFSSLLSVSDGKKGNSSGVPYMYMTPLDITAIDLQNDSRASLMMSLAQEHYCYKFNYDQEDPRCARVSLTGNISKVIKKSEEESFAKEALFSRHPEMKKWPKNHNWFFAKLNIQNIVLFDNFGGVKTVTTNDYFNRKV